MMIDITTYCEHLNPSRSRLNLICKTVASELATVKENAFSSEHRHAEIIPPPRLSPAVVFEINVRNLATFESTVVEPSFMRSKTTLVCD